MFRLALDLIVSSLCVVIVFSFRAGVRSQHPTEALAQLL
jgi:hypothetical protein